MRERSRVELFESIRRGDRDGLSIRDLAAKFGVHRRAVRQALAGAVPPPRDPMVRDFPVPGRWEPIVTGWLAADQEVHRKQRHTAQRVWERLVDEHGAQISASTVRALVARCKRELGVATVEAMVPQTHLPGGEAEVDFGESWTYLDSELVKVHMFVMRMSYSGKSVHYAYVGPTIEAFLDGHVLAFDAFGGVPGRIRYDNLTAAVTTVLLGRDRLENPRFVELRSHYFFDSFFCIPGVGGAHEKGGVEGEIGRFRRRYLTPVPHVASMAGLNAALAAADARDDDRHIGGRLETVGDSFNAEALTLSPLPDDVFDPATIVSARVDTKARVSVRASHYSVPARLVGRRVEAAIGGMIITVRADGKAVAQHQRAVRRGEQVLDLDHYLEVLTRKPGAMAGASALAQARAAGTFTGTHQRFWDAARRAHGDGPGTRDLIGVLQLHRTMPTQAVISGMSAALAIGVTNPDVVAVQARLHLEAGRIIPTLQRSGTVDLTGIPAIAWQRPTPSLTVYDTLLPERN